MFNLSAFLSYAIVVTFTPGPNNILSMVNAGKTGFKRTLNFLIGIALGFFILMLLCSFFNKMLFTVLPQMQFAMSIIGTAYMLYLAFKISGFHFPFGYKKSAKSQKPNSINNFQTGFAMQFINPKVILYGITIISNFIMPYYSTTPSLFLFSAFLALLAFLAVSCWALFGTMFNQFLSRFEKPFNLAMSLMLVYSALTISGILH